MSAAFRCGVNAMRGLLASICWPLAAQFGALLYDVETAFEAEPGSVVQLSRELEARYAFLYEFQPEGARAQSHIVNLIIHDLRNRETSWSAPVAPDEKMHLPYPWSHTEQGETARAQRLREDIIASWANQAPLFVGEQQHIGDARERDLEHIVWRGEIPCVPQDPSAARYRCWSTEKGAWSRAGPAPKDASSGTFIGTLPVLVRGQQVSVVIEEALCDGAQFNSIKGDGRTWQSFATALNQERWAPTRFALSPSGQTGVAFAPRFDRNWATPADPCRGTPRALGELRLFRNLSAVER